MYHQLTSYHLGTNRTVFFMLPRPHIVQSEKTFVNGPRKLEGIQEFFLVVMRPQEIEDICVEAYLETAHIGQVESEDATDSFNTTYERKSIVVEPFRHNTNNVKGDFEFSISEGGDKKNLPSENRTKKYLISDYLPGEGWMFDPAAISTPAGEINPKFPVSIGYECDVTVHCHPKQVNYARASQLDLGRGILEVEASIYATRRSKSAKFIRNPDLTISTILHLFRPKVEQQINPEKKDSILFLTGRGICCCTKDTELPLLELPGISITGEFPLSYFNPNPRIPISIKDANRIRTEIGQVLMQSINHPDRYPRGTVGFLDTRFMGLAIARILKTEEHPDNCPIEQIAGLDPSILKKVQSKMPGALRSRLLEMSLPETVDRFELSNDEAHQLRLALLGLTGPPPTAEQRWARAESPKVPDLLGQSLSEVRQAIRLARLSVGTIFYQDSEQTRGTVLHQTPNAGIEVAPRSRVDLRVASGATGQIPDIVGKPLSEGLKMLREAGLESQPEIVFTAGREQPIDHIIDVTPKSRTSVTPHGLVVLRVSQGVAFGISENFSLWWLLLISFLFGGAITAVIYYLITFKTMVS